MVSLILKILSAPLLLWAASMFVPGVYYPAMYQPIVVGLIISVIGRLTEKMLLKPGTVWLSNIADVIVAAVVIYYSQNFFPGAMVTWGGATIAGVILGVVEYAVHALLVTGQKANSK